MPGEYNGAAAAADIIAAGPVDLTAPKRPNKQRKARKKGATKKGGPKLKSPPFVVELVSAQDLPAADVGINVVGHKNGIRKIVGDVDYEDVFKKASFISPVPGGVGPMTIHCLLANTFSLTKNRNFYNLK